MVVQMNSKNIQFLKSKIDGESVTIRFVDGEVASAKIVSVSESEKDVIFRITSTNRENPSKKGAIRASFDEINSVS